MNDILEKLKADMEETNSRINNFSPWMAQVLVSLPKDPAYKKLNACVREEIETIIAGIE